ncbi:Phage integrase family protein [Caulifigura coniformis]|uniref:Phage integrase family protein n=1 Tax=Caulifigura coniformis TaxID=2527983 RepID=A0A517SHA2_9PLAN|nr:tyrosine-type recombinase/integrase [Caulifigura coniformis]QDT55506.1 Phage integrase family protein [Caulifigura coniformis]
MSSKDSEFRLPDQDLSNILFLVLCLLAEKPHLQRRLRTRLEELNWRPASGKPAFHGLMARIESLGWALSTSIDDGESRDRLWQLTREGYEAWKAQFDFTDMTARRWAGVRKGVAESDFVLLAGLPPRVGKPKIVERMPTADESRKIAQAARPDLQRILAFSSLTGARPYDLITARIESVNLRARKLTLEERSASGSRITDREVSFNADASRVIREAMSQRASGLVFLTTTGRPWNADSLARAFRTARRKAGVPEDVSLSGRGGRVARADFTEVGS